LINKDKLVINNFISELNIFHIFICYNTLTFTKLNLFYVFTSYIRISTNFRSLNQFLEFILTFKSWNSESTNQITPRAGTYGLGRTGSVHHCAGSRPPGPSQAAQLKSSLTDPPVLRGPAALRPARRGGNRGWRRMARELAGVALPVVALDEVRRKIERTKRGAQGGVPRPPALNGDG
jgi:hypothetical protein